MPLPKKDSYTIEDIFSLPDGERAELINGQIYYMAPPSATHQMFVVKLIQKIANYIDEKAGDCVVVPAPFAVFLNEEKNTYVEPDISVICDKNKVDNRGCHGAPDWVIEVISPSTRRKDCYNKMAAYHEAGVRDYWIIDPEKKVIIVYDMEQDKPPVIYGIQESVKANIYDDFVIDFSEFHIM